MTEHDPRRRHLFATACQFHKLAGRWIDRKAALMRTVLKSTSNHVLSSEALATWLLASEELMEPGERSHSQAVETKSELAGVTFEKAVVTLWLSKGKTLTALGKAAGCAYGSIPIQYGGISTNVTKRTVANKVCAALGISVDALFEGKIVHLKQKPVAQNPKESQPHELVSLAEQLSKTDKADDAAKYLKYLLAEPLKR